MDQLPQTPTPLPEINPPHRHFMNMKFLITLVILLVLGGGAYAGVNWYTNKQLAQENAAVPSTSPTPDPTANWQTYTNAQHGFSFKYPADLSTGDLNIPIWPPTVKVSSGKFSCSPTNSAIRPGVPQVRQTTSLVFCVTTSGDGTAGTYYETYSYATSSAGKLVTFDFTVGYVACGAYDEPQKTRCDKDENDFKSNLDSLVGQILSTFKFTNSVDTSTWETFTDAEYGFEFKHPTFAYTKKLINGSTTTFGNFIPNVQVNIDVITNIKVSECYMNSFSSDSPKTVTLNGTEFHVFSYGDEGMGTATEDTVYANVHNNVCYQVTLDKEWQRDESTGEYTKNFDQTEVDSYFNQILSTFKFTSTSAVGTPLITPKPCPAGTKPVGMTQSIPGQYICQ